MTHPERWRDGQRPAKRGAWQSVKLWVSRQEWYAHVWKDVRLADDEIVEVWRTPAVSLLTRLSGERVGLIYPAKPDYVK